MTTQRTSRRRAAAGAALVVAALVSTAACGGGGGKGGGGGDGKAAGFNAGIGKVASASDKKGGELKFIGTQDADSWDPQRGYYGFMWDFARYYTRTLVTPKAAPGPESTTVVPDMATDTGKISDDKKTYTFTLRPGLTWEDGQPITSQHIKYGIERTWATDKISGGPTWLMQVLDPDKEYKGPYKDQSKDKLGLKAIETPDEKTIVFKLPKPNGDFLQMLALPAAAPVRPDKDTVERYGLKPFSSGPYKFVSYGPNKGLELVRNDKWDKASDPVRKALPDKISVALITNAEDMDSRLLAGDYDLDLNATGMGSAGRQKALQAHKGNVDNPQTGFIRYAAFPKTVPPFDNEHCRKAVIYGADHTSLQTARGGPQAGGDIGISMLPPAVVGFDESYDPYSLRQGKPDVAKAKEELKACGKPSGFSTTIAVRNNKLAEVATAESLQASLKAVGIEAQIDKYDGAQSTGIIGSPQNVKAKNYGIIIMGWGADFASGQGFLQPIADGRFIQQSGNQNYPELNDPAVNKLFDEGIAEIDPAKAGKLYQEANKKVMEGAWYLPFTYEKNIIWRSSRLTNVYTADAWNGRYDYASLGVVK
ncbi:peptide ABC transporter substrate-binding protein [Streptomyces eurocidicus]|uniref:Peptide ABC transporter substrate-binding protein n=1 Tax=Streptomyces eurocidicus TaxID=66423 RepID=A0A2N8NQP2_STREU|nr:ABC transporter substrate-binding protein [Streptomyces eurocidicus]MBB5116832.1 peptide/nickel transport system substrate-binding protein [Streptomyces eurocidicus]MBF6052858.1 ABC transporter substrate-binding protein [Streptomyces eurocidicus]PNE31092.1 peptide ABC transporter substrate-binding protein [Streptomyces eurocidicus]